MIPDDKFIELIVAGINRLTMKNAEVEWNVKIDHRQFDVLATIESGLYKVLVAFEVKHKSRPISVDAMDAFVSKARDSNVNKGVFVSTSGYQSGAAATAKKHNIDLFKLTFLDSSKPELPTSGLIFTDNPENLREVPFVEDKGEVVGNVITNVKLIYSDKKISDIPYESSQMLYYLEKSFVGKRNILSIIKPYANRPIAEGESYSELISVAGKLVPPDDYFLKTGSLEAVEIEVTAQRGRLLGGNVRMELSAFSAPVRYESVFTGESYDATIDSLPFGSSYLVEGEFYFQFYPLRYYYCEGIENNLNKLILVESFQMGELSQAIFTQQVIYSHHYIPLSDKKIIARLRSRLEAIQNNRGGKSKRKPLRVWGYFKNG